jgi:DNA-directed RNA polymerase specialized sigma24 family protein
LNRLKYLLKEWGEFCARHIDHADEYGENIIHRFAEYGYTDSQPAGDKTLCADMPLHLKRVDIAVNRLPELQRAAVTLTHCAPVKEDGGLYTVAELARKLSINKGKFRAELRKGLKNLEKITWNKIDISP